MSSSLHFIAFTALCTLQATELAHALRNLPQELKNYKTIAAFQKQALEYLDVISSPSEARRMPEPALH